MSPVGTNGAPVFFGRHLRRVLVGVCLVIAIRGTVRNAIDHKPERIRHPIEMLKAVTHFDAVLL
jgi:hypothetical protein